MQQETRDDRGAVVFSIPKTAELLGLDSRLLRRAVLADELAGFRPGKRTIFVKWADAQRWLNAQRIKIG